MSEEQQSLIDNSTFEDAESGPNNEEEEGEISETESTSSLSLSSSSSTPHAQATATTITEDDDEIIPAGTVIFDKRSSSPKGKSTFNTNIEKWEDSALIIAWDVAYLEYQSLHSKPGIKPQGIEESGLNYYKKRSAEEHDALLQCLKRKKSDSRLQNGNTNHQSKIKSEEDFEESFCKTTEQYPKTSANMQHESASQSNHHHNHEGQSKSCAHCGVQINPAEDETTTNLIMSWYWAGYYAGLSRGQSIHHHQDEPAEFYPQSPQTPI